MKFELVSLFVASVLISFDTVIPINPDEVKDILNELLEKKSTRPLYRGSTPKGDTEKKELDELLDFLENFVKKYREHDDDTSATKENLVREVLPWVLHHMTGDATFSTSDERKVRKFIKFGNFYFQSLGKPIVKYCISRKDGSRVIPRN